MKPRGKAGQARGRRISAARVERWFPGRGSAFIAPPARVFYATKLRASLHWWKREKAPARILESIRKGVKLDFVSEPPTQHLITGEGSDRDLSRASGENERE